LAALVGALAAALAGGPLPRVAAAQAPPRAAPATAARPWSAPRTVDGQPDLQGVWDFRTATPLQRPREFAGKEFFTAAEAAEYERQQIEKRFARTDISHPNYLLDPGDRVSPSMRTSLIVDPGDGRIPPLVPEAQKRADARARDRATKGPEPADSWLDRTLWERCSTRGMPNTMLPTAYNNNLQIFQNRDHVVILMEMIHEARIVALDGRPHASIPRWLGDSRGRWEEQTLVVDTTGFNDQTPFGNALVGERGHLVERFTRTAPDTLLYEITVEDPTVWTRPWTAQVSMTRNSERMYEYACHEGNRGLENLLRGARVKEQPHAGDAKDR
jgi:hypothetical protein